MNPPLDGLRVVELSTALSGAQVGQVLADFGAEVVLVEPPGGSPLRVQPAWPLWARQKQSIELDFRDGADREVAANLAAGADVIIETFRPGIVDRLGLGYEEVSARNPRVVYASITAFGPDGPDAQIQGYEGLVMARLGAYRDFERIALREGPVFVSVPYCSYGAAQTALHGVLAALIERERSGQGQRVDATMVQGFAGLDVWNWYQRLVAERYPDAYVSAAAYSDDGIPNSPLAILLLVGLTADGHWLQFSQVQPRLFLAFMQALGLEWMFTDPEWKGLPAFEEPEKRLALWERMLEATRAKSLAEWQQVFEADPNVWGELFRRGAQLLHHPQLEYDEWPVELDDPERGRVLQPGPLVRMQATPARISASAPLLDEHSDELRARPAPEQPALPERAGVAALPLDGVTILELGTMFAAPYGATVLTDLGARVFKVEPLEGEPIRMLLPFPETGGARVLAGKESIALDMATDEGREIVVELARRSDLVLQSFRAGVAERLGVDPETLRSVNPDLVYLNSPGYGTEGPCVRYPAFAPTIAAGGGVAWRNTGGSVPEGPDLDLDAIKLGSIRLARAAGPSTASVDAIAGLAVGTALLLGLLGRIRGGVGQVMNMSMISSVALALYEDMVEYEGKPEPRGMDSGLYGFNALYRLYETADGWVFLAAPTEREWNRLVDALGVATLRDERFATAGARHERDEELEGILTEVFRARGAAQWEQDLRAVDVGCVAVTETQSEVTLMGDFGRDGGYVVDVDHPTFDVHPRIGPLVRFSRSSTEARPASVSGQHTDALLREIGYDDERIADLRARNIVR